MKIVIVDDDILVSSALKTILEAGGEVEVTGTGQDGKDAVRLYDELLPDVLLMDIRMKDMNGLDAAEQILKMHTDAKILLLTTFSDDEYIVKALKYGVKGYLIKQDYGSILPALQAVQMNQTVFGTAIMSRIPGLLQKEQKKKEQTFDWNSYGIGERELEITALVAEGLSNKEISEKVCLSEGTVRNYISNVLEKLELRDGCDHAWKSRREGVIRSISCGTDPIYHDTDLLRSDLRGNGSDGTVLGKERYKNDRKSPGYGIKCRSHCCSGVCISSSWHTGAADADLYL